MRRILICLSLVILLISGCASRGNDGQGNSLAQADSEPALFMRSVEPIAMAEGYNPYFMCFGKSGMYYCVTAHSSGEEDEEDTSNQFYYQPFSEEPAKLICELGNELMRDFSAFTSEGEEQLAILSIGEKAYVREYDLAGALRKQVELEALFQEVSELPVIGVLSDGNYVIAKGQKLYTVGPNGKVLADVTMEGRSTAFLSCKNGDTYVVYEKSENGKNTTCIGQMNQKNAKIVKQRNVPEGGTEVFLFEDGEAPVFATASSGYITLFDMAGGEIKLMDLNKQSILVSQIQYIFGTREEPKLLLLDKLEPDQGAFLLHMKLGEEDQQTAEAADHEKQREKYAPDGRRILWVAIPEDYAWSMEFHAKKYNLLSENTVVEVERFQGTLEEYLGKGNRPDIVVFQDQTDIESYVQKQLLADFVPLFEKQDKYSLEGVLPAVRKLLASDQNEKMYAMAGRFQLLLRCSDATEYGKGDHCTTSEYLKWYDTLLSENEVSGCGDLSNLLFATVCDFYDEGSAKADFQSDDFKALMKAYQETVSHHKGELEQQIGSNKGYLLAAMAEGPHWYKAYLSAGLSDERAHMEGLPLQDGSEKTYMLLEYPMGILTTSENIAESFGFIMYYCTLEEYLGATASENEYGKRYTTLASFFVYEEVLNKQIFDTEKPFLTLRGNLSSGNAAERFKEYYYTEEQKANLKRLIDEAVPVTKAQKVIFDMLMEEMEGYLQGGKTLDAACEILQNRVELYLKEQK